jgi:uncharacterized protein with HEPN domain
MRPPDILLSDILESIRRIREYLGDGGEEQFLASEKTQAAVLWELIAIGEAARKLPESLRDQFPAVPWRQMIGTRDFLAHGYYRVEPQTVWAIVAKDLPALEVEIKRIVESA